MPSCPRCNRDINPDPYQDALMVVQEQSSIPKKEATNEKENTMMNKKKETKNPTQFNST